MLTLEQYRRLVVNSWCYHLNTYHPTEPLWDKVLMHLPDHVARHYRRGMGHSVLLCINHPLVNSGNAYWINSNTLCLGYTLKTNNAIFRPIFRHKCQDLINNFQENIKKTVLKREETTARYEFVRIKKLPIDIVDKIIEYRGGSLAVVLGLTS